MFTRWLQTKLGMLDPLFSVPRLNESTDQRGRRRPLTDEEFDTLFRHTMATTKSRFKLTGEDRAMLYRVAGASGLRSSELGSLTPAFLSLDGTPPHLTVQARDTKNKKACDVPLQPWLADRMRTRLADRPADARLWPGQWAVNKSGAKMLEQDMAAARAAWIAEAGEQEEQTKRTQSDFLAAVNRRGDKVDFHTLRARFITELARAGVPLQQAQKLARHSNPALTSNHYTKLRLNDLPAAANLLRAPSVEQPGKGK